MSRTGREGSWSWSSRARRDAVRPALDPARLRRVYDAAAHRYDRWHAFATARSDQRGRRILVRNTVGNGDRVLDAGCGTGSTTLLAARAAGSAGSVVSLDMSPGMLGRLESRLEPAPGEAGVAARVSRVMGDMLRLPFPDGLFDVVLSTYSTCPLADPAAGAQEMLRVLKPGGLLGVAHSTTPANPVVAWMAERFEDVAWRWPALSLGCRAVSVLPRLLELNAEVVLHRRIGMPLWPFEVFVVRRRYS